MLLGLIENICGAFDREFFNVYYASGVVFSW
jgi:hypothetical protein